MADQRKASGLREGLTLIWTSSTTFSRIIGMVLIVFAAVSLLQAWVISNEQRQIQECQIEFVDDMRVSLEARGKATNETQMAVDELFADVHDSLGDEANDQSLVAAFDRYKKVREQSIQDRINNPYPEISLAEDCEA